VATGVDKLHAEGLTGAGVKIGIIDTGTDYEHPYLGGGFGPGYLVAGGYDLAGDDYTGDNDPVPDNDPLDQCVGHGTHVAGIIAAQPGNQYNITGVAYSSDLYSYRIFGCQGGAQDDIIIDALIRAYSDDVDVITLSLGGTDGWTESASSVVASRIANRGKIVTIAAGNEGASGAWFTSSPANGLDVISVASTDNTIIYYQTATVSEDVSHEPIVYTLFSPLEINGTHQVYATSNDTTLIDDACSPLPDDTPDLSDYIVLVRRGTCAFVDKLANAADKGARYFLIYNNIPGLQAINVGSYTAALITAEDGEWIISQLIAKKEVELTFPQSGASIEYPDPNGGLVSQYSTYGPTFDLYFKPAIAARMSFFLVYSREWHANIRQY
jgi:subtilisin family serine protease